RKGGRYKSRGYWFVQKHDHPRADKDGYIEEHTLKMEQKIGRYLKWYERVHHRDCHGDNNKLSNLQLTTIWEHRTLHRRDCGQVCVCGSTDVNRNGFQHGRQTFRCKTCGANWIIDKKKSIDFGQECPQCNSKSVIRNGGLRNSKQYFQQALIDK
ncbi:MAG: hypothetical protein WAM42_25985, partial [Candidatus Nitrosopolaris sp.]